MFEKAKKILNKQMDCLNELLASKFIKEVVVDTSDTNIFLYEKLRSKYGSRVHGNYYHYEDKEAQKQETECKFKNEKHSQTTESLYGDLSGLENMIKTESVALAKISALALVKSMRITKEELNSRDDKEKIGKEAIRRFAYHADVSKMQIVIDTINKSLKELGLEVYSFGTGDKNNTVSLYIDVE